METMRKRLLGFGVFEFGFFDLLQQIISLFNCSLSICSGNFSLEKLNLILGIIEMLLLFLNVHKQLIGMSSDVLNMLNDSIDVRVDVTFLLFQWLQLLLNVEQFLLLLNDHFL